MTMLIRVAALLLALSTLPAAAAEHRIPVDGGQALQLDLPDAWHGTNLQDGHATTAKFTGDGDFQLLLTTIDTPQARALAQDQPGLRDTVAEIATDAQAQSSEERLAVRDLEGAQVHGAWFSATDKAPTLPAGEFRYMTQGVLSVAGMPATFTLLVNADDATAAEAIRADALAALGSLRPAE